MLKIVTTNGRGTVEVDFPGDMTPEQAAATALRFLDAYEGRGNADEPVIQSGPTKLQVAQRLEAIANELVESL